MSSVATTLTKRHVVLIVMLFITIIITLFMAFADNQRQKRHVVKMQTTCIDNGGTWVDTTRDCIRSQIVSSDEKFKVADTGQLSIYTMCKDKTRIWWTNNGAMTVTPNDTTCTRE